MVIAKEKKKLMEKYRADNTMPSNDIMIITVL